LEGKKPEGFAEPLNEYRFPRLSCKFDYPSSWSVSADDYEDSLDACRLSDPGTRRTDEQIGVAVFRQSESNATPSRIVRRFAWNLAQGGYRLGGAVLLPAVIPGTNRAFVYCPAAFQNGETASVGATILDVGNYRIVVTVRGVGRDVCPATVAITRRAAHIVRDSIALDSQPAVFQQILPPSSDGRGDAGK
jgi:hypothetical protein